MVSKVLTGALVSMAFALIFIGMAAQQNEREHVTAYCRHLNAAGKTVLPGDAIECERMGVKIMRVYDYDN